MRALTLAENSSGITYAGVEDYTELHDGNLKHSWYETQRHQTTLPLPGYTTDDGILLPR